MRLDWADNVEVEDKFFMMEGDLECRRAKPRQQSLGSFLSRDSKNVRYTFLLG